MIVVIDNTKNQKVKMFFPKLINYLNDNNIKHCIVEGNTSGLNELKHILNNRKISLDGVIMSGSPIMLDELSNVEEYVCNLYCLKHLTNIPILGICFGCQLINVFFGGALYDMSEVKCTKMQVVSMDNNELWSSLNGTAQFCCRYLPKYIPNKQMNSLMYVNYNNMKLPCVMQHKTRKIIGVMFHPEALKRTHKVLDYFIKITSNKL